MHGLQIRFPSIGCLFLLWIVYCAEAFQSAVVLLVYFCFCCRCFWCQFQKIIAKASVKEPFTYFPSLFNC